MRFLHLGDLHIGKRVNEFSMLEEQKYIIRILLDIIQREQVEGVLISGDIYDKAIPSQEAVQVLDEFLTKLVERELYVFIISGNHDSPERLSFGSSIFTSRKVFISPVYQGEVKPITLQDVYGELNVYLLPFVKPATVRPFFPDHAIESYQDAVKTAIDAMAIDSTKRNIILSHQFVTGATRSDSEELSVGGIDNVEVNVYDSFDYVALGHIHRPQKMGRETVCYAGTPLKYSFSEADHKKSAVIVDVEEKGTVRITKIPLIPRKDLRIIKGKYMEITALEYYKDRNTQDYLHIILTDEEEIPEVMGKLRPIYPNIMKLTYENSRTQKKQEINSSIDVKKKSPMELFEEFYKLQNNQELKPEQTTFLQELMEGIDWGE